MVLLYNPNMGYTLKLLKNILSLFFFIVSYLHRTLILINFLISLSKRLFFTLTTLSRNRIRLVFSKKGF